MAETLDWSRFRTRRVGPERAFEAFAAQLFERWLRRVHGSELVSYTLKGSGGDGGVEAFAMLPDGSVIGLQAKWFPENLNAGRVKKIRKSLDVARASHPTMAEYVVAIPQNLTKGGAGKGSKKAGKKKARTTKGGVEHWETLAKDVKSAYPNLTLHRWDEAALWQELAVEENRELHALWFEGELSMDVLRVAWDKARARLGARYLPDLHARGEAESILQQGLWTEAWRKHANQLAAGVLEAFVEARRVLSDFHMLSEGKRPQQLTDELSRTEPVLCELMRHTERISDVLATGPTRSIAAVPNPRKLFHFRELLQRFEKKETYLAGLATPAVEAAIGACGRLEHLDEMVRRTAHTYVVAGSPGCGKTHASAREVEAALQRNDPGVFISGRDHDPAAGAQSVLAGVLDLPGWPLSRMLDALEALAILSGTTPPAADDSGPRLSRALIIVDGVEERNGWKTWENVLLDLDIELQRRPRIHLAVMVRPESVERLALPESVSHWHLPADGGADVPKLLARYASEYGVDVSGAPWIGWTIRTPLEVRLLAEEFAGRRLTASDTASVNMLNLFRRKLNRIEEEARTRQGAGAWSENLGLVHAALEALSDETLSITEQWVKEADVLARLGSEPEFIAERVRSVLGLLREQGLVDVYFDQQPGLRPAAPSYRLSTQHLSDFVLANQAFGRSMGGVGSGGRVQFPQPLHYRPAAMTLFLALLAEQELYAPDVQWIDPPDDLFRCYAQGLGLVPPAIAGQRAYELSAALIAATARNREVLRGVVVPACRVPDHPVGGRLLDAALRTLSLAERDPIWSVPDDLGPTGPWQGNRDRVLDEIILDARVDRWDGLPLVLAWTCSSVVEGRRARARRQLAAWGTRRLSDMTKLVRHMANCDDPQVVADVYVAAFGAAVGARVGDPALRELAVAVDDLLFVTDATAPTASVPVRIAARGIVERAAAMFPGDFDAALLRARPPYAARGPEWPPIDPQEEDRHWGGSVVSDDLSWYVAKGCFDRFSDTAREDRPSSDEPQVDSSLLRAMAAGDMPTPTALEGAVRDHGEMLKRFAAFAPAARRTAEDVSDVESTETGEQGGDVPAPDAEERRLKILSMLKRREEPIPPDEDPEYSEEFRVLLKHAANVLGEEHVSMLRVRNGMIAHLVRSWGWSEEKFSWTKWDAPIMTVDRAIAERNDGRRASHGARTSICDFREKYVWAAVDIIAGELADRCPVWSELEDGWVRLDRLDDVGNGFPDPLPELVSDEGSERAADPLWEPVGILPRLFENELDPSVRAERWLTEAPLPDVTQLVHAAAVPYDDAVVLALEQFRGRHQSCVQQLVRVRAFAMRPEHLALLKRDISHLSIDFSEAHAWIVEGSYTSPAVACWASWLSWRGVDQGYVSFDDAGKATPIEIRAAIAKLLTATTDDWPAERNVWCPTPWLSRGLGIVGMHGTYDDRSYVNHDARPVVIERRLPEHDFDRDTHYLVMDRSEYVRIVRSAELVPVWIVRVLREATPALFMDGSMSFDVRTGLHHRSRDAVWIVVDRGDGPTAVLVSDELEPWGGS